MIDADVVCEVWDKTCTERVWIGDPTVLTATPRHNQQPTGSITIPVDHRRIVNLEAPGARVVVRYRGEHVLSGPVRSHRVEGDAGGREVTFEIEDDWRLLTRLLAWQVPTAPIEDQSAAEHHVLSGPAETVAKTLLAAAITRTGAPITVAPSLGRGATIDVQARMVPPADVLLPMIDQAGIGLTVQQIGSQLVLDAYEPTTWPHVLSESNGTLTSLSWSRTAPTVTRVVLGADGEGTDRVHRQLIDHAREGEWGDVIETFVDARDLKHDEPGFEAAAAARMQERLAAGRPLAGLSVSLAEAGRFRYGRPGVRVGDLVRVELAPGTAPVEDVLRAATLTWGPSGARVTPVIGERRDDPDDATARAIAAAHRALRALQTRR